MARDIDFQLYNDFFLNLGAVNSPSEVHGMLCGKLACGNQQDNKSWVAQIIDFTDLAHVNFSEEQLAIIDGLIEQTTASLCQSDYTFTPLLPDDEASISRRSQELGYWCQGFLHGVGTSGLASDKTFSADVSDAIKDLAKISQIDPDESPEGQEEEESEKYLVELIEYVKVAVIAVYSELGAPKSSEFEDSSQVMH